MGDSASWVHWLGFLTRQVWGQQQAISWAMNELSCLGRAGRTGPKTAVAMNMLQGWQCSLFKVSNEAELCAEFPWQGHHLGFAALQSSWPGSQLEYAELRSFSGAPTRLPGRVGQGVYT